MTVTKRHVDVEERRARLVRRHHLDRGSNAVTQVAGDLVGLHSSDAATVYLSARARVKGFEPAHLEDALYADRTLARVLGMRRTMFVLPMELVPVIHAACTRATAARERKRTVRFIEEGGIAKDGARWLKRIETATMEALEERGEATAAELSRDIPALRKKIPVGIGTRWEGTTGVSTRVLFLLANSGRIIRAKPRGSWLSTQYRWAPMARWSGIDIESWESDAARHELTRRWLHSFGPATIQDLRWWTGWTLAQAKSSLDAVGAVPVELEGEAGFLAPDDLDVVEPPRSRAVLLPSLDPSIMGWFHRDWYLGGHRTKLFDRNGNAGPSVWWEGHVVGGWAQRPDGEILVELLEGVGSTGKAAVEREVAALRRWLGDVRFIPRFRTPLEKSLYGSGRSSVQ